MANVALVGSNINRVKSHNMRAVLLSLLHLETASRVQLAQQTSLSTTTITNLIDELIQQGLVEECGLEVIEGPRPVGRPRASLRLVNDARAAIGIHVGVEFCRVAVVNLRAEIRAHERFHFDIATPPQVLFEQISVKVEELIQQSGIERSRIVGVGVGAAGLVNYQSGINLLSPNLGWTNVPIRDWLSASLDLPVVVDNNVKAMALGEAFLGAGQHVSSLAFVYGRTGVGSGLVIENRLLRGANLGAGEIGHMIVVADGGLPCRCGQCGCLETLISEGALVRQTQARAAQYPAGRLAQLLAGVDSQANNVILDALFQAGRAGDADALELIASLGRYLGIALANLVNLLNPEMIVLGGLFAQGQDLILPATRQALEDTAFAGLGKKVRLLATPFGWRAGVIGAAALALTSQFYLNPEETA